MSQEVGATRMRLEHVSDIPRLGPAIPLGSGKTMVYGGESEFQVVLTTRGFLVLHVDTPTNGEFVEVISFDQLVASWLTEFSHDDPNEVLDLENDKESGPDEKG